MGTKPATSIGEARSRVAVSPWMLLLALLLCLLWSYWPTLVALNAFWQTSEDYSVGQLVPLVAAFLIWQRRTALRKVGLKPCWWGLLLIAVAQGVRFAGIYYAYGSLERLSILGTFSGGLLLVAGWGVFRHLVWVQAFLVLMVPLPYRVHNAISLPLQDWATSLGLFGLELLGYFVTREGNVLRLGEHTTVMVAEACSGLRMLTAFVFTAAVLTFLVKRPVWQRVVLLTSSVPIAVLANGVRIMATAMFIDAAQDESLEQGFHDLAGVLMMPLAIAILLGELHLLAALTQSRTNSRTSA